MSESIRMWMEIDFNSAYFILVWILMIAMLWRQPTVPRTIYQSRSSSAGPLPYWHWEVPGMWGFGSWLN